MFGKKKVEPKRSIEGRKCFEYGGAALITINAIPSVYHMYTKRLEAKIMKELSIQNFVDMDEDFDDEDDE